MTRVSPPRHARAGFSLIEVMGALLILSVGMVSAVRLATSSMARLRYVDHKAEAVRVARERIEGLEWFSYSSLTPSTWLDTVVVGTEKWAVTHTVTQWSTRVRKVQVNAALVGDTVTSGPIVSFLADTW